MTDLRDAMTRAIASAWRSQGHRITSDHWPGVLIRFRDFRVSISRKACEYLFQEYSTSHRRWGPARGPSAPAGWAARFHFHPDFAKLLRSLPDDPRDAAAMLAVDQGLELPSSYRVRYWAAPNYSGVIVTDQNLRSVVDRSGRFYAIQFRPSGLPPDDPAFWITQAKGSFWPDLVNRMRLKTFNRDDRGSDPDRDAITSRLCDLFDGCPYAPQDGPLPCRPEPLWLSSRSFA